MTKCRCGIFTQDVFLSTDHNHVISLGMLSELTRCRLDLNLNDMILIPGNGNTDSIADTVDSAPPAVSRSISLPADKTHLGLYVDRPASYQCLQKEGECKCSLLLTGNERAVPGHVL